jgi:hypothetical protein
VLRMTGSIGIFVSSSEAIQLPNGTILPAFSAPGAQWLMQPALPSPPPPSRRCCCACSLVPPSPHSPYRSAPAPLSLAACILLRV